MKVLGGHSGQGLTPHVGRGLTNGCHLAWFLFQPFNEPDDITVAYKSIAIKT